MRTPKEVSDIIRLLGKRIEPLGLNTHQLRTLSAIGKCRTAELGGHVDACTRCGVIRISYNSCRNRHCPKCQGRKREEWIAKRNRELLPVPYFHLVFTLPSELNALCLQHPRILYALLFKAAWHTLQQFGMKQGVKMGMIALLHTWGQNLSLHPHLHCIVPGGGLDGQGGWCNIRTGGKFLFPVKALSLVFRAKFVALLRKAGMTDRETIEPLFSKPWVVYAKRPFKHPAHVVEYLGRYTHKVAISNNRILSYENGKVRFSYKDYRSGGTHKVMELDDSEFVRRFALHILPAGFMKIRHFGILSSGIKVVAIPQIREQLPQRKNRCVDERECKTYNPLLCPCCGHETMITIETIRPRAPPAGLLQPIKIRKALELFSQLRLPS